ncbi:MAG: D-alanine--D-alanine ligase [Actinomycetota bacterium]
MPYSELKDKRIGVLMGGLSREREVSLRSGQNCLEALQRLGYKAVGIDAGRDLATVMVEEKIEVAFIALHGRYGEDGAVQGLLEVLDIPYTGSGVLASALGMDKVRTKQIAMFHGIPTPAFVVFNGAGSLDEVCRDAATRLKFPVMLKPRDEGSSLGIVKVAEPVSLNDAVSQALAEYEAVLAEEFIEGDEITVGLIETEAELTALPVLQLVPRADFYDYEAKYNEGMTEFILPARIPAASAQSAQELAKKVHRALGCRGFSRVDFIIDAQGTPQLTEINTLPGMTETSDLPAQAAAAGIGYDSLVEIMLGSALLK